MREQTFERFSLRDLGWHTAEYDRENGTVRLSWTGGQTDLRQAEVERLRRLLNRERESAEALRAEMSQLSVPQRRSIFRGMLRLARSLAAEGVGCAERRVRVGQGRDHLVKTYLEDIAVRSRRGHLR